METTYFVLGMLSIIVTITIATIVWGVLRINKQQQRIQGLEQTLQYTNRDIQDKIDNLYSSIDLRIDEQRRSAKVEYERIYHQIGESRSYTDSRIDKVTSSTSIKQVIKG